MKWWQWLVTGLLLAAMLITGAFYLSTRESGTPKKAALMAAVVTHLPLVDQSPLQRARHLSALASSAEEQGLSQEALRVGDHAVDLAFADAVMEASEHPAEEDPKNRDLAARLQKIQTTLAQEQSRLGQLKAELAAAKASHKEGLQSQIALLQAQEHLDEDDLEDAKQDLIRAGGNPQGKIERLRQEHEASEHSGESLPAGEKPVAMDLRPANLLQQVRAWSALRAKRDALEAAHEQEGAAAHALAATHTSLEQHVSQEAEERAAVRQRATGATQTAATGATTVPGSVETLTSLQHFANDQRQLADLDKRIQDEQELGEIYGSWAQIAATQQRAVLHAMLASFFWILLILLLMYLTGRLMDRFLARRAVSLSAAARPAAK